MSPRYFGTDGVRGRAFEPPLRVADVARWGAAWGRVARRRGRSMIALGWDPRASSPAFARAFAQGARRFVTVRALGMLPTPAVARCAAGTHGAWSVMISASHNPPEDNGLKGFDARGEKIDEAIELEIEREFERERDPELHAVPLRVEPYAAAQYVQALGGINIAADVTIVLDCAHGATATLAPQLFRGAGVRVLGAPADGARINVDCGATCLGGLQRAVLDAGAALGVAFDGDGDRCMLVGPDGREVDGDQLLWLLVRERIDAGARPAGVVGTVMSNGGLEAALRGAGVEFVRTPVGDKHLSRTLRERGWELAAESSGHLIHRSIGPTGDGLATALAACATLLERDPSTRWDWRFAEWPLATVNVRVEHRVALESCARLLAALERIEHTHGAAVRVIARWSGTEPKLRLTAEARDEATVRSALRTLEEAARADLAAAHAHPTPSAQDHNPANEGEHLAISA